MLKHIFITALSVCAIAVGFGADYGIISAAKHPSIGGSIVLIGVTAAALLGILGSTVYFQYLEDKSDKTASTSTHYY